MKVSSETRYFWNTIYVQLLYYNGEFSLIETEEHTRLV